MDYVLPIVFSIFFIITLLIIVYIIYDYLTYKSKVDKSIEIASTEINKGFQDIIKNVDTHSNNIVTVDRKLEGYNDSLKKFFSFNDENNNVITNEMMFNHAFDGITPNLELLSQVNAISGLKIKSSSELINEKNMKICNNSNGCVNMNVNSNGFNITPNSKVNNININDNDKYPLASFDLAHKSIYLGGNNETNSPFYIKNNDVHIKNAKLYKSNSGDFITPYSISNKFDNVEQVIDQTLENKSRIDAILAAQSTPPPAQPTPPPAQPTPPPAQPTPPPAQPTPPPAQPTPPPAQPTPPPIIV
jgi:hypothetical protein